MSNVKFNETAIKNNAINLAFTECLEVAYDLKKMNDLYVYHYDLFSRTSDVCQKYYHKIYVKAIERINALIVSNKKVDFKSLEALKLRFLLS